MSEPPGLPSALGIEAVECISEGGSLTVRVTGRWRRRRPEWRGPAILVVEAQGTRYRFPAMPEPPSVIGTMPGTWRMSFSVARELAPHLAGRSWLQLGSLVAPLPVLAGTKIAAAAEGGGVPDAPERAEPPEPSGAGPPLERRRPGELAIDAARRRADEAEAVAAELALRVDQLEQALEEAWAQPARLERARRAAEQSAHAEAARRSELEEQLAEQERALEEARARAAALALRVEELERELRRLRRAADEAMHVAAGERAARLRAEQLALERPPPEPEPAQPDALAERLGAERRRVLAAEAARAADARARRPAPDPAAHRAGVASGADELQMRARRAAPAVEVAVAEQERARRIEAEHRAAALERTLAERTERWARAYAEIDHIRDEIGELRRVFAQIEPAAPAPAGAAAGPAGPAADPAEPAAGPVQADRLSDALARLRERTEPPPEAEPTTLQIPPASSPRDRYTPLPGTSTPPPRDPAAEATVPAQSVAQPAPPAGSVAPPAPPAGSVPPPATPRPDSATRPWLWPIFRSLAREDPLFAGQVLLHLLPAWHAVDPLPVACDLILGDRACVQVTVGAGTVAINRTEAPRRPEEVHFQVRGDLERLARTVAAGRLRRRLGRGMARVSGDHEAFARLGLLVRARLTLVELHDGGVRFDPTLTFRLVARMVDQAWTVGERFTVVHRLPGAAPAGAHLDVKDGAPLSAGEGPPAGPADATIVAPAEALVGALSGRPDEAVQVEGRPEPLARLVAWIDRAQSA